MFERLDLLIGKEKREVLQTKTVVIIGVGGVGGYVAESLARSGVGHLVLIDYDTIDITNKNRQIIALDSTIGMSKVEVLKSRILDINSECIVDSHDTFLTKDNISILDSYKIDYLVDACDTLSTKKEIIDKCTTENISFISSMGTGNKLNPTMLEVVDISKTSVCPLAKVMRYELRKRNIKNVKVVYSKEEPIKPIVEVKDEFRVIPGSTSFVPPVAGYIIASEVIKDLIK